MDHALWFTCKEPIWSVYQLSEKNNLYRCNICHATFILILNLKKLYNNQDIHDASEVMVRGSLCENYADMLASYSKLHDLHNDILKSI